MINLLGNCFYFKLNDSFNVDNKNDLKNYGLPFCLIIYFFIAWLPLALNLKTREFFPFFAFNLYSFVPDIIENKNLLVIEKGVNRVFVFDKTNNKINENIAQIDRLIDDCLLMNDCAQLANAKTNIGVDQIIGIVQFDGYYYQIMNRELPPYKIIKQWTNDQKSN